MKEGLEENTMEHGLRDVVSVDMTTQGMECTDSDHSGSTTVLPDSTEWDFCRVNNSSADKMSVPKFYAGKKIFVTGATGFMGKVLLEKLLRSCPDLDTIYCLMRSKKNACAQQRIKELMESKVFDRLRKIQPDFRHKVVAVSGDVLLPDLGISVSDRKMLEEGVHVVYHSAASIKFDEEIRVSMEMNVVGVQKMIKLCRNFKHLEAFIHVSTAFANCNHRHMEEIVYTPSFKPQQLIDFFQWADDETTASMSKKFLQSQPNTYTFTKQLGEWVLLTEGAGLPVAIVRPAIVAASWKEPFPGWIDRFTGPSVLCVAMGKGLLRSLKGYENVVPDIIPVDIACNVLIVVGWYTAVTQEQQLLVYHANISSVNPLTWGQTQRAVVKAWKDVPLEGCFRRPVEPLVSNSFLHRFYILFSHLVPAALADLCCMLTGRKPTMLKIYGKMHHAMGELERFTSNSWTWDNNNLQKVRAQLSPRDLKTFYFDAKLLDWQKYIRDYCIGCKKYLLKEEMSRLPAAHRHLQRLQIISLLFNAVVLMVVWHVLLKRFPLIRNLGHLVTSLMRRLAHYLCEIRTSG